MYTASAPPVATFKKGPSRRPQQSRKRSTSPSESTSTPTSNNVVRPTKKPLVNPLVQGSKRRREPDGEEGTGGGLEDLEYRADEGITSKGDSYATRANDWDLEPSNPESDPSAKSRKIRLNEDGDIDDGIYRGQAGYLATINKTRELLDKKMQTGPIRATANIRTITLVDYQPDVCKPYKETGFCGYGDSCKFLHDRGDYLAGWQLDKLDGAAVAVPVDDDEEELPFACLICKKEFAEPVVTKCGHYFCMNCAVKRFVKSPKCYACGAPTSGIYNKAEKILAKLEEKNKRKREARGVVEEESGDGGIQFGGGDTDEEADGGDGAGSEVEQDE